MRDRLRAVSAFIGSIMGQKNPRTIVYVDGFNLYYGSLKNTSFRWLDIAKLCELLLPRHNIVKIRYYTAKVKPRGKDPHQDIRQQLYLRALRTIPNIDITFGHFLSNNTRLPLANPQNFWVRTCKANGYKAFLVTQFLSWFFAKCFKYVYVVKTEEKGSDVNLAAHILRDAYENRFDAAVIISNDSDLLEPIRIVKEELKKEVGLLNPHPYPSKVLLREADFYKPIRKGVLSSSQFPESLKDEHGDFSKPKKW